MKFKIQNRFLISLFAVCSATALLAPEKTIAQSKPGIRIVVIDPGHGGKDSGCERGGIKEKDLNLKVALLFGKMIEDNLPDVKVIYTRNTDVFIDLDERPAIANKAGADLFISIHTDATKSSTPQGSHTFVMGLDKLEKNLDIAMRENDVITYEEDYSTKYEGYVPGSTESYIMFSLAQYAYLEQSIAFANTVQNHYAVNTRIPTNRGVGQAPFWVLWRTAMPSVLTEMGFLSNASDKKYLTSAAGQEKIARSLFNAFSEYKGRVEGNTNFMLLADQYAPADYAEDESDSPDQIAPDKNNGIIFMVQIKASQKRISTTNAAEFGTYKGKVVEKKIGKFYRYFVGTADSFKDAAVLQKEAAKKFKGAFVVAFRGGEQIKITDDLKK